MERGWGESLFLFSFFFDAALVIVLAQGETKNEQVVDTFSSSHEHGMLALFMQQLNNVIYTHRFMMRGGMI